jgi:hypothetical protein
VVPAAGGPPAGQQDDGQAWNAAGGGVDGGSEMKKQYEVKMKCVVYKLVTCEGCTEEQAAKDPFKYAIDEMELEMVDWEVTNVKEDK